MTIDELVAMAIPYAEILVVVLSVAVLFLLCFLIADSRRIRSLKKEIWELKKVDVPAPAPVTPVEAEADQSSAPVSVFRRRGMPLAERNRIKAMFFDLDDQVEEKELFLESDLTREKFSENTTFSKDQASDIIKRATGGTFVSYVNGKRISRAILELREHKEYTVEAVAYDSGFGNARNFYRVFRELFGISPTEYRSAMR